MATTVIVNPYANRWQVRRLRPIIQQELYTAGINYAMHVTEGPGHGVELARRAAAAGETLVVAAGGDGTVSEVVNGLCAVPGSRTRLGILPLGTGNDLAFTLGLPEALHEACARLVAGEPRPLDVGH